MPFSDLQIWINQFPLLKNIIELKPVTWINNHKMKMEEIKSLPLNIHDMAEAQDLMKRFAPFLENAFPEMAKTSGLIESPLREIEKMKSALNKYYGFSTMGKLLLKCDNELPVAGSIKARGGFYEVLHYAEQLALQNGLLKSNDDYAIFASPQFREFFSQYSIGVGSTGNLGLSIGIMGAKLGFRTSVFMSADAKEWKKNLLRNKGAEVLEFSGDFGEAIAAGRLATHADPKGYFVDDENSKHLYLGYSTGAFELKNQLAAKQILIDADHPLFVYLPCGIGGSPGGTTFGLKQLFGNNVHCFFVEPTHSPSVLIGLLTGKMEKVSVQDFGIDNLTEADGLAVGRPSAFATAISKLLISGEYTIEDVELFRLLYLLKNNEHILVEPSATAGLIGPGIICKSGYIKDNDLVESNITHVVWATGGLLVPEKEMDGFYEKGGALM